MQKCSLATAFIITLSSLLCCRVYTRHLPEEINISIVLRYIFFRENDIYSSECVSHGM